MNKILLVSATSFEIAPTINWLNSNAKKISFFEYELNDQRIIPLVTGVGAMMTAFGLARLKGIEDVTIAINLGLAGSFLRELELGEVVNVAQDRFADLGVEEADGSFTDVQELGLMKESQYPFEKGWIHNKLKEFDLELSAYKGITVNTVHGTERTIAQIRSKFNPDVESMEGAAFLYACRVMDIECVQLRAISNYVETRNRANWKIDLAIENVNQVVINFISGSAV